MRSHRRGAYRQRRRNSFAALQRLIIGGHGARRSDRRGDRTALLRLLSEDNLPRHMLNEDDPRPNWAYWRDIPTVSLFEAVALSLNVDPRVLRPHVAGFRS